MSKTNKQKMKEILPNGRPVAFDGRVVLTPIAELDTGVNGQLGAGDQ